MSAPDPLGISEMVAGIGDENITLQRLGVGRFQASEHRKDCLIQFASAPGNVIAMERGELIGLVLWIKQADYDRLLAARKGPQP